MKRTFCLAPFAVGIAAILCAVARADSPPGVEAKVQEVMPGVVELRRDFHAHPELSNREERTARVVAGRLRGLGLEVQTGVARHGVVALLRGTRPGRCAALRADMDALPVAEATGLPFASKNPGVMHACGHDAHTAALLGAAEVLASMKDELSGTVKFIFQPAEEGPPAGEEGGALLMVEEGVLEDPKVDAIFALHVFPTLDAGKIGYTLGGTMASVDRFKVTMHGEQTHAAYPWDGVDPVVASAHAITALQTIASRTVDTREPVVVSVGVVEGGQRWNIIPESITFHGTVRAHSRDVRAQARRDFERILSGVASAHGTEYELEYEDLAPVTYNDPDLARARGGPGRRRRGQAHDGRRGFRFLRGARSRFLHPLGRP
jgi:amidohydrolase